MTTDGTTGYGSVGYTYQIGKYDVTAAQYCQFLNAVAGTDTFGLYFDRMAPGSIPDNKLPGHGITRDGSPGSYTYSVVGNQNFPAIYVTWGRAARFVNWLSNGQPVGPQGPGTTETGSYALNGAVTVADFSAVERGPNATYVIPTENEWYKAAYYKGGSTDAGYWRYATGNDETPSNVLSSTGTNNANFLDYYPGHIAYTDPVNFLTEVGTFAGSRSAYGTFDQCGNVWQWNETPIYASRGLRGGAFDIGGIQGLSSSYRGNGIPTYEMLTMGLRVALVPEPATLSLLALGSLLIARRRRA
jgi:formylglycine-generating enzyme required for sulfatase activity